MPNVQGKKFPYTMKGKADAAKARMKPKGMKPMNGKLPKRNVKGPRI